MITLLAKILEKFTIEFIPKLPLFFRTPLYVNILRLRKVRDRLRLDVTSNNPTFQERMDYALDSRNNLNNSGQKLLKYNKEVLLEEVNGAPIKIFKFTPPNANNEKYLSLIHI